MPHTQADDREERLKQLLHDCNAATKDLNAAIKEARAVKSEALAEVSESLNEAVKAGLEEYAGTIEKEMESAVKRISAEFAKLSDLFLGKDKQSQKEGKLPLEELFRDAGELRAARLRNDPLA